MIDKESFEEWLAHPVTEWVLDHFVAQAEARKQIWINTSWGSGESDPVVLRMLRETARLLTEMSELKFEDLDKDEERIENSTDRI